MPESGRAVTTQSARFAGQKAYVVEGDLYSGTHDTGTTFPVRGGGVHARVRCCPVDLPRGGLSRCPGVIEHVTFRFARHGHTPPTRHRGGAACTARPTAHGGATP